MERYVCIHGHFYQPPRENPWLETVQVQDSAAPFHDWNERITRECYAPNAASRILDQQGFITDIVNNYSRISFNFGPTLLSWLEAHAPEVYRAILQADAESRHRFGGTGSAIAQCYSHLIMPLANDRDRQTQVRWGIADFRHRFGRDPLGMWLPETAVDRRTLDVLAAQGIRFTILAPTQAARVRPLRDHAWQDVSGGLIDPTRPYLVKLPSGRSLTLFFYNAPIARAVAFERLLESGEALARRLVDAFLPTEHHAPLVHIATDGETFGHHHRFGDMALAYALHLIEKERLAQLTHYAAFLERHPPTHEVEIFENTSWSCAHGVERWRSDCGCNTGRHPGWNQAWRAPLRAALDWLRDELAAVFQDAAAGLLRDPWGARDDYIQVVLDRSAPRVRAFLQQHAPRELDDREVVRALSLLEMQRHAMLMYTSCGWFFDDLAGIETVQCIQHAARALQLAEQVSGRRLEAPFLERLRQARSNEPAYGDGAGVYERLVRPAMADPGKVLAHHAVCSLFENGAEGLQLGAYDVTPGGVRHFEAGRVRLRIGRATVRSRTTWEQQEMSFAVLHLGDHTFSGGVSAALDPQACDRFAAQAAEAFRGSDLPRLIRLIDQYFGPRTYDLRSLFPDGRRRVIGCILAGALADVENQYRHVFEHHAPVMRFLTELGGPIPRAFALAAEFILNADLRRAFQASVPDLEAIGRLLNEVRDWHVELDASGLAYAVTQSLEARAQELRSRPEDIALLENLSGLVALARSLPFWVDLFHLQNVYYELARTRYRQARAAGPGAPEPTAWVAAFEKLGQALRIRLPT